MSDTNCPEGAECGIHNRRDVEVYYGGDRSAPLLYCISYVNNYAVFTCETMPPVDDSASPADMLRMLLQAALGPQYETHIVPVGDMCLNEATGGTFQGVKDVSKWHEEYYDTDNIADRHHMTVDAFRGGMLDIN